MLFNASSATLTHEADVTVLSFNNWITYNPTSTSQEEEDKVYNKVSNKKSNIAKIDDNQNPIKLLPIVGKAYDYFSI